MSLMKNYDLQKRDVKFRYMFLDRLRLDCLYYLGNGARHAQYLWTQDERKQIDLMREVYASLPVPPEWLTPEDIADLEKQMIGRDSDMTTNDKHILDLNWEPAQYQSTKAPEHSRRLPPRRGRIFGHGKSNRGPEKLF